MKDLKKMSNDELNEYANDCWIKWMEEEAADIGYDFEKSEAYKILLREAEIEIERRKKKDV